MAELKWQDGAPPDDAEHGEYEVRNRNGRWLAWKDDDGWTWSDVERMGGRHGGLPCNVTHYYGPLPALPKPPKKLWKAAYWPFVGGSVNIADNLKFDTEAEALKYVRAFMTVERMEE